MPYVKLSPQERSERMRAAAIKRRVVPEGVRCVTTGIYQDDNDYLMELAALNGNLSRNMVLRMLIAQFRREHPDMILNGDGR